jgi:WhiB family transcriptional regulator, redox-sensing transcriptional regulator
MQRRRRPDVLTGSSTESSSVANLGNWLDPTSQRISASLPCQADPDLWFAESPMELERAKAFCAACPARGACLAGAQIRQEPCGVWGGEIFDHGRIVAAKRGRGRPRKDAIAA